MDSKFYVSYEAEMMLWEKGCNLKKNIPIYNEYGDITGCYPADRLTKAEAIDWLESKGIVVEVQYRRLTGKYFSEIHYNKMRYKDRLCDLTEDYKTRLEAGEAAIIKALELL